MAIHSHYDALKVARNASSDAIRAAYKSLIMNPGKGQNPGADGSSSTTKAIHDAYAVLSNPVKRADYDRWLLGRESEQIGKVEPDDAARNKRTAYRWLVYSVISVALLVTFGWIVFEDDSGENGNINTGPAEPPAVQASSSSQTESTQDAKDTAVPLESMGTPMVVTINIPEHDQVAVDAFNGTWSGINGSSGGRQTLAISSKSADSFVFRLDAKAGQGTGGVYGIAQFDNSYAHFFNEEYQCSILFTMQSGVLVLNTDSCQEYHEKGVSFDGSYRKPASVKAVPSSVAVKPKPTKPKDTPQAAVQAQKPALVNAPKLRKYSATVKDPDGNVTTIELIAKDKDAARTIIRDFRGNPKILKLKEVKN
jgi:hypothetical protein